MRDRNGKIIKEGPSASIKSLRDEFALVALRAFTMSDENVKQLMDKSAVPQHKLVADFCYNLADAMIERRKK